MRVVILPRAYTQESEFAAAVAAVEEQLRPSVVRIRFTFGDDWSGERSVFFKIVLSDAATARDRLLDVTKRASAAIVEQVEPEEQWGVFPYFNYRSQSEQAELNEPAWA
jgi:hypothetical protein